jgi:hypothetical protein
VIVFRAYPESVVERFGGQVLQIRPRAPRTGATVLVVLERGPQEAGGGDGVPERQRSGDTFGISSYWMQHEGTKPTKTHEELDGRVTDGPNQNQSS